MKKPSYLKVYESVKEQIINGNIAVDSRLPTEPQLARRYDVSIGTLRRGLEYLEREKYIRREQGRGTFAQLPAESHSEVASLQHDFVFGSALNMRFQQEFNELYFSGYPYKQVTLPSPAIQPPANSEIWQSCSLVQLPMIMFRLPELNNYLAPLPEEFTREAEKVVPENILNECRSIDGQLRLIPTVANPSVCYCWKPGFSKAGLPLPGNRQSNWTEFIDITRKLSQTNNIPGFGIMPFPGLLYEILLWSFGGDFYDNYGIPWLPPEAFENMIGLLRILYREHLCYNPFGLAVTGHQFFSNPEFCMTFYGPLALPVIDKPDEWHISPVDIFSNSPIATTVIGLSIPTHAPEPEKALELLTRIFIDKRKELLSCFTSAVPAAVDALDLWSCKQEISGAESFKYSVLESRTLSGRTGYANWYADIYSIIDEAAKNLLDLKSAREQILDILAERRVRYNDITILT